MRFGLLILSVFAAAWASAGLLASHFTPASILVPMAISGAVILAAVVINARAERRPDKLILPEARRLGRARS